VQLRASKASCICIHWGKQAKMENNHFSHDKIQRTEEMNNDNFELQKHAATSPTLSVDDDFSFECTAQMSD